VKKCDCVHIPIAFHTGTLLNVEFSMTRRQIKKPKGMSCNKKPNLQQTLTLCRLDGPLIKYPQFLDVLQESSSSH